MKRSLSLLVLVAAACGKRPGPAPSAATVESAPRTSIVAVQTIPADTDPCTWLPADVVAGVIGKLSGTPWRGDASSHPEADPEGPTCVYPVGNPDSKESIAIRVISENAETVDGGFALVAGRLEGDAGKSTMQQAAGMFKGDTASTGWDFIQALPDEYTARQGALAVQVGIHTRQVPWDSIARLATMIRENVPDLPFALRPADRHHGAEGDACALVTPAEAESILGTLAMAPYRSSGSKSGLADPGGDGCSYYLGRHHLLSIDVTWEQGKVIFSMSAGLSQRISATVGVDGTSTDTLEGAWDQAGAGPTGSLYFLKGDAMLEIRYIPAGVDQVKAVELAQLAIKRLK